MLFKLWNCVERIDKPRSKSLHLDSLNLVQVHSSTEREPIADILFIHGLGGDHKSSWCADGDNTFWPLWLSEELNQFGVFSLNYASPKVFLPSSDVANMPLYDKAIEILDCLVSEGLGKRPLIIISHSLGGLLTKQILRSCNDNSTKKWDDFLANTKGVIFFGTPHDGSSMANLALVIPILKDSKVVEALKKNNPLLRELKGWYSNNANRLGIKTKAYYETKKNKSSILIVDENSSNPAVSGCCPVPVDGDHSTMNKPADKHSSTFKSVLSFIEECLLEIELDEDERAELEYLDDEIERYKVPLDRLTLEEKLIKGKRDYDIKDGLRKKLDFAKKFKRHSAQKSSNQRYTLLLGEVETRFSRHVYSLIARNATVEEINLAVQEKVIDPIVEKYSSNDVGVNAILIDEMIFYLTGLCNIRWHHE